MLLFYCLLSSFLTLAASAWEGMAFAPVAAPEPIAQPWPEYALSGRILNDKGSPLPGAVVLLKGTSKVTTTNAAGDFLITITTDKTQLELSCLGYQDQTIDVRTRSAIAVTLYPLGVNMPLNATPSDSSFVVIRNTIAVTADVLPAFPGGQPAYRNFLVQNARYPAQAKNQGISGVVYVSFVIDEIGRIVDPQILKGCNKDIDEEALRLVRIMPRWTPGLVQGKPIAVAQTIRIPFELTASR